MYRRDNRHRNTVECIILHLAGIRYHATTPAPCTVHDNEQKTLCAEEEIK